MTKKTKETNKKTLTVIAFIVILIIAAIIAAFLLYVIISGAGKSKYDFAELVAKECGYNHDGLTVSEDGEAIYLDAGSLYVGLKVVKDKANRGFCPLNELGLLDDSIEFSEDLINNYDSSTPYKKIYRNQEGARLEVEFDPNYVNNYTQELGNREYSFSFKGRLTIRESLSLF